MRKMLVEHWNTLNTDLAVLLYAKDGQIMMAWGAASDPSRCQNAAIEHRIHEINSPSNESLRLRRLRGE